MPATAIADKVHMLTHFGANVYFVGDAQCWVLIDAGWPCSAKPIIRAARALFGTAPQAILLTHAHPDHHGAAARLAALCNMPVYLHADDMPLVTKPITEKAALMDPVGKPLLAVARWLPGRRHKAAPLAEVLRPMPPDPPCLADWQLVPTPGHSAGHVAFFRPGDGVLIAGDAVLTAGFGGLAPWRERLSLPLRATSLDWTETKRSVQRLAALSPRLLATGHGRPMQNAARALSQFAQNVTGEALEPPI